MCPLNPGGGLKALLADMSAKYVIFSLNKTTNISISLLGKTYKKISVFLVVTPLRGGVKPPEPLRKKTLFSWKEIIYENIVKNMNH